MNTSKYRSSSTLIYLDLKKPFGSSCAEPFRRPQAGTKNGLPTQLKYDSVSEFQGHHMFVKSDLSNLGADTSPKGVGGAGRGDR